MFSQATRSVWLGSTLDLLLMKSSGSIGMSWAFCQGYTRRGWTRLGSLPVSAFTGDTATGLKPAQECLPMLHSLSTATHEGSLTREENKTCKKRGNAFIPVFPCPSDLQVSVGNSLVRPAPGTDLAGTDFEIAACGSRQEEEQPQQFCVKKKHTAAWT